MFFCKNFKNLNIKTMHKKMCKKCKNAREKNALKRTKLKSIRKGHLKFSPHFNMNSKESDNWKIKGTHPLQAALWPKLQYCHRYCASKI